MKIVIVGAPLSGKTTLLRKIKDKGYDIFQPDFFMAKAYANGEIIYEAIKETFGPEFVNDKTVDRVALAKAVFNDKSLLEKLEMIVNPILKQEIDNFENVFIEASGAKIDNPDKIVLVKASKDTLIDRYKKHLPHLNEEYVETLIDKWDNKLNNDLEIDTSEDIKEEDVDKVIELIK